MKKRNLMTLAAIILMFLTFAMMVSTGIKCVHAPPETTYYLNISMRSCNGEPLPESARTNPPVGTYAYAAGQSVLVHALVSGSVGWDFYGWFLDGSMVTTYPYSSIDVLMDDNHTAIAEFNPKPNWQPPPPPTLTVYYLTISMASCNEQQLPASVTTDPVTGTYAYTAGDTATITASIIPSSSWYFDHWLVDDSLTEKADPITLTMNGNHSLVAVFNPIPTPSTNYTLQILTFAFKPVFYEYGHTSPTVGTYTYPAGTSVTVTAYNDNGPLGFRAWYDGDGNFLSTNPTIVVQVNSNMLVFAMFQGMLFDVAVTDVLPSKTIVGQGYGGNVTVSLAELSDYPVTFNLTVYANATSFATQNVTLSGGNSTDVMFTWNTMGFAYGNYTINGYALPISGETNTTNNNCTGGLVAVSIPGDLNGDFKVSLEDLIILAVAYDSHCANYHYQGEPASRNWNPNADVNNDGTVNLGDFVILSLHYGQHYP